mmetsp:Transcript_9799/g.25057  ORF Transcript_9799/g.25057 Transcript_9799/m.25057 type:complete len:363 (+) Transcript_9799:362-1450(+)
MARVDGQRLRHYEQSFGECLHPEPRTTFHCLHHLVLQVCLETNLKCARTRNNVAILNHVLNSAESVSDRVLDLRNSVVVWPIDEKSATVWVLHTLDEGVLILAQDMLVHLVGVAKHVSRKLLDRIHSNTAASQNKPFHIPLLRPPESDNAVLLQDIQGKGIDALLVNHNEALSRVLAAHLVLQLDDLVDTLVRVLPLGRHHLLALVGIAVEEARVHLTLVVLQGNVAGQDVAVFVVLGHVGVPRAMVQHQSVDKLGVSGHLVTHMHDFHHVQVDGLARNAHSQDSIGHTVSKLVRKILLDLGPEGGVRHAANLLPIRCVHGLLHRLEVSKGSFLSDLKTLDNKSRVKSFVYVFLSLLQQLPN